MPSTSGLSLIIGDVLPYNSNDLGKLTEYYSQFGIWIGVDSEQREALVKLVDAEKEMQICLRGGGGRQIRECHGDGREEGKGITLWYSYREVMGWLVILSPEDFVYASENGILIGGAGSEKNQVHLLVFPGKLYQEIFGKLPESKERFGENRMYLVDEEEALPISKALQMKKKEISPLTLFYGETK